MSTGDALAARGRAWLDKWRQLQLAGDRRAGRWARARARSAQRDFARRNWRFLLAASVFILALSLPCALLMPAGFARGFFAGAVTASTAGALMFWVVQATGTAPTMMGDLAEQWTASELRKLRRRGWRVVNHVLLQTWDIDHVLIGPGGVFAIETKWSASPWQLHPPEPRIERAIEQARHNAKNLEHWHDFRRTGAPPVTPVVMLWGTGTAAIDIRDAVTNHRDTTVLVGVKGARWFTQMRTRPLDQPRVDALWHVLNTQVARRDPGEDAAAPVPPSLTTITARGLVALTSGVCALLAALACVRLPIPSYLWPLPLVGLLVAGLAAKQVPLLRPGALGWIAGVLAGMIFILIALAAK